MPQFSAQQLATLADDYLRVEEIPDYPPALNGLQLDGDRPIRKIACAVDACEAVIQEAVEVDADMLVVHHGLFWQGAQKMIGGNYRKFKKAIDHGLAIYSAHIPLDVHPAIGNNALLVDSMSLGGEVSPFFPWKGIELGLKITGEFSLTHIMGAVEKATGFDLLQVCQGHSNPVRSIGVITGGAGSEIAAVAERGIDTFITGEGPHWSYTLAEELGLNLLYAGHYATETFGVKALASRLAQLAGDAEVVFIEHPTGL